MRNSTLCAAIAALLLGAGPASAHHAFSKDFDRDKPITLSGTVTRVQWTAPHVYTYLDVKDDQGKTTNWKVEMGNPTQLTRQGWTRTMLKAGQAITIQGWRAKNGTNFANADTLSMPDGKKLSAGSSFYTGGQPGGVATSGTKTPKPEGNTPKY